jgi:hypothetical protein
MKSILTGSTAQARTLAKKGDSHGGLNVFDSDGQRVPERRDWKGINVINSMWNVVRKWSRGSKPLPSPAPKRPLSGSGN